MIIGEACLAQSSDWRGLSLLQECQPELSVMILDTFFLGVSAEITAHVPEASRITQMKLSEMGAAVHRNLVDLKDSPS